MGLSGFALTPLEFMIVLSLFIFRSATIAVKYGFRPKSEMIKFHSETDPDKAESMLTRNLLSSWMNPEYSTIVTLLKLASEHTALKTNVEWFTQNQNLHMHLTFVGKERCKKVFEILHANPGAVGNGSCIGKDNREIRLDKCPLQLESFGSVQAATRESGAGLRELASLRCPHNDVHYMQVPAGTLISGLFLKATQGSTTLARVLVGFSTIVTLLLLVLPMCVR